MLDIYRTWSIKLVITPKSLVRLPALIHLFHHDYLVYRSIGPRFSLLINAANISLTFCFTRCAFFFLLLVTRRNDKQVEPVPREQCAEKGDHHGRNEPSTLASLAPRTTDWSLESRLATNPQTSHPFQPLGRPRKWRHELAKAHLTPLPSLHPTTIERCSYLRGGARG